VAEELFERVARFDVFADGRPLFHELLRHGGGAIENGDGETFAFHVQHEVFAHDGESDKSDVTFFHKSLELRFDTSLGC